MIEEKLEQETAPEKETGRLEAFSDGVFAVAITLLVFDLKVPALDKTATSPQLELAKPLLALWPSYFTFFISFATILIMWVSHHSMFKLIQKSNTLFMFANGFLLLLVTIVPFTSALVSAYLTTTSVAATACAVYSGLFMLINVAYNLLWWSAAYHHHLLKPNVSLSLLKTRTRNYLLGFPSYLLAMVLAFWNPAISIGICSVLWLFWAFTSYERAPTRKSLKVEQA